MFNEKEYHRKYRETHKEENKAYLKIYRLLTKEKRKQYDYEYYRKNREKIINNKKIYHRINYPKKRDKILERIRKYKKLNPEVNYKSQMKRLNKLGQNFNLNSIEVISALLYWSKSVRKKSQDKCQICGLEAKETHHILHKNYYPKLMLNFNNGIALCKKCHWECHGHNLEQMNLFKKRPSRNFL